MSSWHALVHQIPWRVWESFPRELGHVVINLFQIFEARRTEVCQPLFQPPGGRGSRCGQCGWLACRRSRCQRPPHRRTGWTLGPAGCAQRALRCPCNAWGRQSVLGSLLSSTCGSGASGKARNTSSHRFVELTALQRAAAGSPRVGGGDGIAGQGGRQHLPRPSTGCPRSSRVTGMPASARVSAANRPAGPLPTTTTASACAAAPPLVLLLAVGSTSPALPLDCAPAPSEGLQDGGLLASEQKRIHLCFAAETTTEGFCFVANVWSLMRPSCRSRQLKISSIF